MNVQRLSGIARRFEILAAIVPQAEVQTLSNRGLLNHVRMAIDLIADCGPDKIGAVRVKPLLHQEVYLAEVDVAQIDRDLFRFAGL